MATTTLFFILIGVGVACVNLMKLVEWLDTPHETARRAKHPTAADNDSAVEFPRAELELESALYAA